MVVFSALALFLRCGDTLKEVQVFSPNQGPVITEFTHDLPMGTSITASTAITLHAKAVDPEGKSLRFEFLSEDGSFSGQTGGADESTVVFHAADYLVSAQEVKASVWVYDSKRSTDQKELILGTTVAGPSVKLPDDFNPYVRADGYSEFSFTANASGLCQYYVRDNEDPSAAFSASEPCFYYNKGDVKTIIVGGPGFVGGDVTLFGEASTPDRLYIILMDSLSQEGVNSVPLYVDGVNPVSSASPNGATSLSAIPVSITCTDNRSGCTAISYTLNGTDPDFSGNGTVVQGSTANFNVGTTKGIYTLKYRSRDRVGNVEAVKSAHFEVGVCDIAVYQGATPLPSGVGNYVFPGYTNAGQSSAPVIFSVKNEGNLSLTLFDVFSDDPARFEVAKFGTPATLGLGESRDFSVTFKPVTGLTIGTTITVTSDDPDEGSYTFTVKGTGAEYTVTYVGTGSFSGDPPVDPKLYGQNQTVTVLGNTGNLVTAQIQDGINLVFLGWNTQADGSGNSYLPGQTFSIGTSNATLYAQWSVLRATGPAGGLVFYDKGNYTGGWRYLEAAPYDQGNGVTWACYSTYMGSNDMGAGEANTAGVLAQCPDPGTAIFICANLSLGGFDNWYLPAYVELQQMYAQLQAFGVGGFVVGHYYCSNGFSYWAGGEYICRVSTVYFGNGSQGMVGCDDSRNARAIRKF